LNLFNLFLKSLNRTTHVKSLTAGGFLDRTAHRFTGIDQDQTMLLPEDLTRLEELSLCFTRFGEDPQHNINQVLERVGQLLHADMLVYHRYDGQRLTAAGAWNLPETLPAIELHEGVICFDMFYQAQSYLAEQGEPPQGSFYLTELQKSMYAQSDPLVKLLDISTYVGRLIFAGEQVIGACCVLFKQDYALRIQDEYPLSMLASVIGIEERRWLTLDAEHHVQEQLEAQVRLRTEELLQTQERLEAEVASRQRTEVALTQVTHQQKWLIQMARDLNQSLELHAVLERIGAGAQHILSGDACAFYLLEDGGLLRPALALDEPYQDEVLATPLEVENSLTGKAVLARQALIFNNANQDMGAMHIPGTPLERDEHLIAAPFIVGDAVLGVMTHNRVGQPFTQQELALAQTFADYAAAALHNARLYDGIQTALQELQDSEIRYQNLFDNAAGAIYIANLQGRIIDVNRFAEDQLGYTRDELIGMHISEIVPNRSQQNIGARMAELKEKKQLNYESVHLTRDGQEIPVSLHISLLEQNGRSLVFGLATDISERVLRERERDAMVQISQALRLANTRDEMFPIVCNQMQLIAEARCAYLYLGRSSGVVSQVYRSGSENLLGLREFTGLEAEINQLILTGELFERTLPPQEGEADGMHLLALPLVAHRRTLGAVLVARRQAYSEFDCHRLITVADIAASAMHRASLHEDTRRQLRRLEALHTIERAIASILNLDTLLKIVLQHVVDLLEIDAADILLYEAPTLGLTYAAGQGFKVYAHNPGALREAAGLAHEVVRDGRMVYLAELARHQSGSPALEDWLMEEGFVSYLGVPLQARGQVVGVLELFQRKRLAPDVDWRNFLETLASQTAIAIDKTSLLEDLQRTNMELTLAYDKTLEGWAKALELRDKETKDHSRNVTDWTLRLARQMGVPEDQLVHIRRGTLLHDIGKMAIPDEILKKPGPLSADEWRLMKQHPVIAYELLAPIPYLRQALEIPYCHHERMNGSGYPRGLMEEQIPLSARIFAVVDVWDALRENRYYRSKWPEEEVRKYLSENAGVLFDAHVVSTFLALLEREDTGD
jgi:PAS domain S-box-containing protein